MICPILQAGEITRFGDNASPKPCQKADCAWWVNATLNSIDGWCAIKSIALDLPGIFKEEVEGCARLIAAAPEMYGLLHELCRTGAQALNTILAKGNDLLARIDGDTP